jgi:hypothetical protein
MRNGIIVVAIIVCWGGFFYKLRDLWRDPRNPALRALCALLLAFAVAITIGLPPVYQSIPLLMANPSRVRLAQHLLAVLGAFAMRVLFNHITGTTRPAYRFWMPYTAATLIALVVLFGLAPVGVDADDFVGHYAAAPFVTEYLLVFLVYTLLSLAEVFVNSVRNARRTPRGLLRFGLRLLACAGFVGMLYALHKAGYALARRLGFTPPWPEGPVSTVFICVAAVLFIVGATVAGWVPKLVAWRKRFHRYRAYRRLRPLWSAIYDEIPNIALIVPRTRTEAWQTVDFLLYRRIIEIRDGTLALRPYIDEQISDLARKRAVKAGLSPVEQDAVVEAATLAAALRAKSENRVTAEVSAAQRPSPTDLDGEARWLAAVSDAYRKSPLVAQIAAM